MHQLEIINSYIEALDAGDIVLLPTDSCICLACHHYSHEAYFKMKNQIGRIGEVDPVLLVSTIPMLKRYVPNLHPRIETLLVYHKRPLTMIYNSYANVSQQLIRQQNQLGIRLSHHPFCNALIERLGVPLLSFSLETNNSSIPFKEIPESLIANSFCLHHEYLDYEILGSVPVIATHNDEGELTILRN